MESFLVESYLPGKRATEARAAGLRAHAAAEAVTGEGRPVRYVRTTFLPEDETCFHVFEALSLEAVHEVGRRARLKPLRVVAAVE